jgi:hypothetical protein
MRGRECCAIVARKLPEVSLGKTAMGGERRQDFLGAEPDVVKYQGEQHGRCRVLPVGYVQTHPRVTGGRQDSPM